MIDFFIRLDIFAPALVLSLLIGMYTAYADAFAAAREGIFSSIGIGKQQIRHSPREHSLF